MLLNLMLSVDLISIYDRAESEVYFVDGQTRGLRNLLQMGIQT